MTDAGANGEHDMLEVAATAAASFVLLFPLLPFSDLLLSELDLLWWFERHTSKPRSTDARKIQPGQLISYDNNDQ